MSWWRRSRPPPAGEPATSSSGEVGGQDAKHKGQVGQLVKVPDLLRQQAQQMVHTSSLSS